MTTISYKLNSILCINNSFIKLVLKNNTSCDGCYFHNINGCLSSNLVCSDNNHNFACIFKKL